MVDDDPGSLKLMVRALRELGYEVRGANHGARALEAAEAAAPLAVVLDLMMPEMDGFEFLDRFRKLAGCRAVPVLVWTVKDLGPKDYARLRASAQAILEKGRGAAAVVEEIRRFLPALTPLRAHAAGA